MSSKFWGRKLRGLFCAALSFSLFISALAAGPIPRAGADVPGTSVIAAVNQLQSVYYWLGKDPAGKSSVDTAVQNLTGLSPAQVEAILWPQNGQGLLPLNKVKNSFGGVKQAQDAISKLLTGVVKVPFAGSASQAVTNFYNCYSSDSGTVEKLLPGVSLDQLCGFFLDAQNMGLQNSITSDSLKSIFVGSSEINNYSAIQDNLAALLSNSLRYAGTSGSASDQSVYSKLLSIGWTVDDLAGVELAIDQAPLAGSVVDPGCQAEIALLKAYVRSQTHFTGTASSPGGKESLTIGKGSTSSGKITAFGLDITGDLSFANSSSAVTVAVNNGKLVVTGVSATTAPVEITAYYGNQDTDWVYKGTVSVTATGLAANQAVQQQITGILSQLQSGGINAGDALNQVSQILIALTGVNVTGQTKSDLGSVIAAITRAAGTVPTSDLSTGTSGNAATISVITGTIDNVIAGLKNTISTINTALSGAGLSDLSSYEVKQITITVPADISAAQVNVQIPSCAMDQIYSAGMDLVVNMPQVSLDIPPQSLPVSPNTTLQLTTAVEGRDVSGLPSLPSATLDLAGDILQVDISLLDQSSGTSTLISSFNKPINLSLAYNRHDVTDPDLLTVWTRERNSSPWTEVFYPRLEINTATGQVTFATTHNCYYAVIQYNKTFTDTVGCWAQHDIEIMAARGVVSGVTPVTFAPDAPVTRAQFATSLVRLLGLSPAKVTNFADVPQDAWYAGYVGAAYKAGLVQGCSASRFDPDGLITREQAAVMLAGALKLENNITIAPQDVQALLSPYKDKGQIDTWARPAVALMIKEGIMQGVSKDMFYPLGQETRAEAAVMLYQALKDL